MSNTSLDTPREKIFLDFPLIAPHRLLAATVVLWLPTLPDGHDDIAGLKIQDDLPQGVEKLRLQEKDLHAVIEQPAALPDVQLNFEDELVNDLLFEMRGQPGALPLLQFTLDQLFLQHK